MLTTYITNELARNISFRRPYIYRCGDIHTTANDYKTDPSPSNEEFLNEIMGFLKQEKYGRSAQETGYRLDAVVYYYIIIQVDLR